MALGIIVWAGHCVTANMAWHIGSEPGKPEHGSIEDRGVSVSVGVP